MQRVQLLADSQDARAPLTPSLAAQINIQPIAHITGSAAQSIGDTLVDVDAATGQVQIGVSSAGGGGAAAGASG